MGHVSLRVNMFPWDSDSGRSLYLEHCWSLWLREMTTWWATQGLRKLLHRINKRVFIRNWPRRSHMIKPEPNRAETYHLPNSLFTGIPGYGQSTSLTMLPSVLTPFILSPFQLFCSETIYEAVTMGKRLIRALSMDKWLSGPWVWSQEHSHYLNGVYGPEGRKM